MFGIARLNTLARYEAPAGPAGSFGLYKVLDNPNAFGTVVSDNFGNSAAISNSYAIVGARNEDDSGGTVSGKAYIYSTTTGSLLYTLNNPNAYDTSANDNFGYSVAISESHAIVGAYLEGDAGGLSSGKAYIYSTSTGSLLYTLNNPNAYDTSTGDGFGWSVAITNSYAIVGAYQEDDAGGTGSGKAYIYSTSTGSLLYTLNNPNAYDTSATDQFGTSVGISESYAIVSARLEDDASGSSQGKAYIYSTSTGSLLYTLDNPNTYASAGDAFGQFVDISESYAIVSTISEDEAGQGTTYGSSGKAYIYSTTTGSLITTLDDPNAFLSPSNDQFGTGVGITNSYAIVGAQGEGDAGGSSSGKAYIYSINPADHISINDSGISLISSVTAGTTTIVITATAQVGDIAVLFDTSTTTTDVTPSGWTSINGATTTGIRTNISYRILTSGDAGSTITGMAGTTRKVMLLFRDWSTTAPTINVTIPSSQATTAAPTSQTIAAGAAGAKSIYLAAYGATSTTPTRGFTQTGFNAQQVSSVSAPGLWAHYTIRNIGVNSITQASATITMTDGGTNTLQSFRMNIS
jgi:hypothetical protein